MQLLSEESFSMIEPLLSDDYKRIRSRIALVLGPDDSELFATVDVLPNRGKWLSAKPVKAYSEASPLERELIAAAIEDAKAATLPRLAQHIPGAENLYRVPAEECIYWYRDADGKVGVVLTQWGFRRANDPGKVDVIELLMAAPRPLSMVDVTLEAIYNYGAPVTGREFDLSIFNNTRVIVTDAEGRYSIGKVKNGVEFSATDRVSGIDYHFTVTSGREIYRIEIGKDVDWRVRVIDRNLQPLGPGYRVEINGERFGTNDDGIVEMGHQPYSPDMTLRVSSADGDPAEFKISPDGDNDFVYQVNLPLETPPPPPEPEPRKVYIRILDVDGSPLDGVEVHVDQPGGVTVTAVSNADGVAEFPRDTFVDKKKSNVRFVLTAEYQRSRQEKKNNRNGK